MSQENNIPPEPDHDEFGLSLLPDSRSSPNFDPSQWAWHGVLRAYVNNERGITQGQIRAAMVRLDSAESEPGPSAAWFRQLIRHRWTLRGIGLAAAVILAAMTFWPTERGGSEAQAEVNIGEACRVTYRYPYSGSFGIVLDPSSATPDESGSILLSLLNQVPEKVAEAHQRLEEQVRIRLEKRDAARARPIATTDPEILAGYWQDIFGPWEEAYRLQRDAGQVDLALAEIDAALAALRAYQGREVEYPARYRRQQESIVLSDKGETLAMVGDVSGAADAYAASLDLRLRNLWETPRLSQEYLIAQGINHLPPVYWNICDLMIAKGDLRGARFWLGRAEDCLRDYYIAVLAKAGVRVPADANPIQLLAACPTTEREGFTMSFLSPTSWPSVEEDRAIFRAWGDLGPSGTRLVWTAAHYYQQARIHVAEGDYDAAWQALQDARQVCGPSAYAVHDERRLAFTIPLEEARVCVLRGEFEKALDRVAQAERHLGGFEFRDPAGGVISRGPVSVMRVLDLAMIKGLALSGHAPILPDGRNHLGRAYEITERLAHTLSAERRESMLARFKAWGSN